MTRQVTEKDLRRPEFSEGGPEDYEFRKDGKLVRKDRWEQGLRSVAMIVLGRGAFEVDDVVDAVRQLHGVQVLEAIRDARFVFESEPKAIECLDYLEQLRIRPKEET
jgi:hypothetical protein